ncbi:MAG: serine/threonine protein kinase, partial [Planctomycetales bacterium]|nr:serine/threonine protein kinase [Planctomycetales bacterium]
ISHPHVVSLLASQTNESPYFVVAPFLPGASLRCALDAGLRMPPRHALWVVRQAAEGLAALHAAGWLHGDAKPDNIHVGLDGHVTLLDLGLARPLGRPGSVVERPLAGTLTYLAPEWFIATGKADARSEVYSLGVVLFELLAGRPPFVEQSAPRMIEAHLQTPPPKLESLWPGAPASLSALLSRALAKQPLRRFASAGELAEALCALEIGMLDFDEAA